jgi:hypothetical protein
MKNFFLLVLALLAVVAIAVADEEVTNGEVVVNVLRQSGKISFWLPTRADEQFSLALVSLCETNGGDCANTFASESFNVTTPEHEDFENMSTTRLSFESTVSTPNQKEVSVHVDLHVFHQSGNYSVGEQEFKAVQNGFKWSVKVSGWIFNSSANKLELTMSLQHPSLQAQWNATTYTLTYPVRDNGLLCSPLHSPFRFFWFYELR